MLNLPLSLYSLASQRILSQSSNIGYQVRGIYRTEVTPEDRKADYNFRDYQVTLLTNCLSELGFRAVQTIYASPRMTEALGLNRLSEIYGSKYPDVEIKNYKKLPEIVRARMMGTLVKKGSIHKVPVLLEKLEADLLAQDHGLSQAEQAQLRILLEHLHKNLNFKDYLNSLTKANGRFVTPETRLSEAEVQFILAQRQRIMDLHGGSLLSQVQDAIKADPAKRTDAITRLRQSVQSLHATTAALGTQEDLAALERLNLEKTLDGVLQLPSQKQGKKALEQLKTDLKKHFDGIAQNQDSHVARLAETIDWAKELPGEASKAAREKLLTLIHEGVTADKVLGKLRHIQMNCTWPQMAGSVLLTFIFYGTAANFFDVKVLQPWQKKLVEERGTSQAYVKPSYLATIPALATLALGLQNKFQLNAIRRLSYFNRFAVTMVAMIAAYVGSFLPLLQRELKKTAPQKPAASLQTGPTLPSAALTPRGNQANGIAHSAPAQYSSAVSPFRQGLPSSANQLSA
jgi:hypothetical protein